MNDAAAMGPIAFGSDGGTFKPRTPQNVESEAALREKATKQPTGTTKRVVQNPAPQETKNPGISGVFSYTLL